MQIKKRRALKLALLFGDALILYGSIITAYWIRFNWAVFADRPVQSYDLYHNFSILVAIIGASLLYYTDEHKPKGVLLDIDIFFSVVKVTLFAFLMSFVITFSLRGVLSGSEIGTQSRILLIISCILACLLLVLWRGFLNSVVKRLLQRGLGLNQVIIVGINNTARRFFDITMQNPHLGYKPLGYLQTASETPQEINPQLILGSLHELDRIIRDKWIDQIIVVEQAVTSEEMANLIRKCELAEIQFSLVPNIGELLTLQGYLQEVSGIPLVIIDRRIFHRWNRLLKRSTDLCLSFILFLLTLPALAPLIFLVSLAIKLESPGPILFRQKRIGMGGRPFFLYKFRSMYADAEAVKEQLLALNEAQGPLFKIRRDPRITRIGRLIRKFSIDEIPQLLNVLRGEMSLVGPRPPVPSEVNRYQPWHLKRFDVRPGMVGLPQVSGRSDLSFDEVIRLDLYYIENWSLLFDLKILLKTVPVVVMGKGAY